MQHELKTHDGVLGAHHALLFLAEERLLGHGGDLRLLVVDDAQIEHRYDSAVGIHHGFQVQPARLITGQDLAQARVVGDSTEVWRGFRLDHLGRGRDQLVGLRVQRLIQLQKPVELGQDCWPLVLALVVHIVVFNNGCFKI